MTEQDVVREGYENVKPTEPGVYLTTFKIWNGEYDNPLKVTVIKQKRKLIVIPADNFIPKKMSEIGDTDLWWKRLGPKERKVTK